MGVFKSLANLCCKPGSRNHTKPREAAPRLFGSAPHEVEARAVQFVEDCAASLAGAPASKFRISASVTELDKLQAHVDGGGRLGPDHHYVTVAGLLKRWLGSLPAPLLPPPAEREPGASPTQVLSTLAPLERQLAALVIRLAQDALAAEPEPYEPPTDAESLAVLLAPALLHSGRGVAAGAGAGGGAGALKSSIAADVELLRGALLLPASAAVLDTGYVS